MVKKIKLVAETISEKNGSATEIRNAGMVPAILYGKGIENKKLKVKKHSLDVAYNEAGESSLVDIEIDGKESAKVIIKDIQKDHLKDTITHVDFYQVDMTKPIEVEVPLNFINESKAEKELGGVLVESLDTLRVRCLPSDLIEHLDVDLSALAAIDDVIRVADLKIPESFEILNAVEDAVASVMEKREEEEEEPVEEEIEEGEEKQEGEEKKKEGEEKQEGEEKK